MFMVEIIVPDVLLVHILIWELLNAYIALLVLILLRILLYVILVPQENLQEWEQLIVSKKL
jgi:hypothetical protein